MMGMGMIGAIGGLGEGVVSLGGAMQKDVEEERTAARKKDYEGWLLAQQDQYAIGREGRAEQATIRTEQRTDTRSEEQKNRDFGRLQTEAPTRRDIKVADTIAGKEGELKFESDNRAPLAAITASQAEAKQTAATKKKLEGEANKDDATAEYYRGVKSESEALRKSAKLDPADDHELKGIEKQLEGTIASINKVRSGEAGVPWDPAKNPGQAQMAAELGALRLRQSAILGKYRGASSGNTGPDPLGARKPAGMIGDKPYTMDSPRSAEPPVDPEAAGLTAPGATQFNTADPGLKAGIDNIKDPVERARARAQLAAQQAPMGRRPATSTAPPLPVTPPAAAADPATPAARPVVDIARLPRGNDAGEVRVAKGADLMPSAPAAPQADPLQAALGATGGSSIDAIVGAKAPVIKRAAEAIAAAQQEVVRAAQSKDQLQVSAAMRSAATARLKFDLLLQGMEPGMAQRVRASVGM